MRKTYFIILVIMVTVFMGGCCTYRERNLKPDDELSRSIKEALGKDFYYLGKDESKAGDMWYRYQIKRIEPEAVKNFVQAVNDYSIGTESEPIDIIVYSEVPGGLGPILRLKNFSESDVETDYSGGMYWLYICECDISIHKSIRDRQPSLYTQIEGIRELCIDKEMQSKAEEEGIDWYSCWPTLEKVTIIE